MSTGNPIIQRELISVLRTVRALAIQVMLVAALGGVVVLLWPEGEMVNLDGHQARQLFRTFVYGLLVCMLLLAPVFPATTIVRERHARTLQLLLTSRLSPLAIVFGKIAAAVGFILLLLVLSLPPAAACYTMGGVGFWTQIAPAYAILAVCAVQYALIGLVISSYARTSDSALRMTYGTVLGLSVLTLLPFLLIEDQTAAGVIPGLEQIKMLSLGPASISPIPAIIEVAGHKDAIFGEAVGDGVLTGGYLILSVISIVVCAVWLIARLQPKLLDRARAAGRITDEQSVGVQRFRRIMFLGAFDPQRREQFIGLRLTPMIVGAIGFVVFSAIAVTVFYFANAMGLMEGSFLMKLMVALLGCGPAMIAVMFGFSFAMSAMMASPVVVKEFRSRALGRSSWMMRLIAACLIVSLTLTLAVAVLSMHTSAMGSLGGVLVIFQMGLVLLIGPALSTALISGELESGGWELLLMTRLRASQIVLGKLISVTWTLVLLLLATVPGYVALLLIDIGYKDRVMGVLICLVLTAMFTVLLSAACSSLFRRTTAATSAAYVSIVVLCVGTLVPWLGEGMFFGHALVEKLLRLNPVASALSVIDMPALSKDQYHLTPFNWQFLAGASALFALVLWMRTWWLTRPK